MQVVQLIERNFQVPIGYYALSNSFAFHQYFIDTIVLCCVKDTKYVKASRSIWFIWREYIHTLYTHPCSRLLFSAHIYSARERRAHQIYKTNTTGGIAIYRLDRERALDIAFNHRGSGWIMTIFLSFFFFLLLGGRRRRERRFSRNGCIPKLRWAYDLFIFLYVFSKCISEKKRKDCLENGIKQGKKTGTVVTLRLPSRE